MKTCLVLVVLVFIFELNWAYVARSPPSTHEDFPNQCYVKSEKKGFAVGQHTPVGICERIICAEDFSYTIHGCGSVAPPPGYRNERDLTKPYPDCCVNLVKIE